MKISKSLPFLLLLAVGIGLTSMSIFWARKSLNQNALNSSGKTLGVVEAEFGDVWVNDPRGLKKNLIKIDVTFTALETIETSAEGTATLVLDDGHRIRLLENSALFFESASDGLILHLAQGRIQTEAFGTSSITVSKEGQRVALKDFSIDSIQLAHSADFIDKKKTDEAEATEDSSHTVKNELGLSKEIIQSSIAQQRSGFFRCYSSLLQRTPGVTGQVNMKVMIERSGKPSVVDILTTTLREPQFRDCLLEVARRIEFKPFKGDAITTVFPIKFE